MRGICILLFPATPSSWLPEFSSFPTRRTGHTACLFNICLPLPSRELGIRLSSSLTYCVIIDMDCSFSQLPQATIAMLAPQRHLSMA